VTAPSSEGGMRAVLDRTATRLRRRLLETEPTVLAVEVRPHSLGVVRLSQEGERRTVTAAASLDLPTGALSLSMTQPNILDPAGFSRTLKAVLERTGALEGGGVALVLPDPVARVALLPAAEVASRGRTDLEEMLRFRLKRAVPFDVREARVATLWPQGGTGQLVVAAIYRPILESYERALRDLGFEPGQVEITGLALAEHAALSLGDSALVNWDHGYVSIVILRDGWPILVRTLVGDFTASAEPVVREAANTILYYRERLAGAGLESASVRSAFLPPEAAAALLREPLGVEPRVLDPWAGLAPGDVGPATQALAGAAAALLRGVVA
jgi:Tfp pilus assembly PilM family ATPase